MQDPIVVNNRMSMSHMGCWHDTAILAQCRVCLSAICCNVAHAVNKAVLISVKVCVNFDNLGEK